MKKLILTAVALMLITACSESEESQTHKQAAKLFDQAQTHINNASLGYINDRSWKPAIVSDEGAQAGDQMSNQAHMLYQLDQLTKAEALLEKMFANSTPAQKIACSDQLSEVKTYMAQLRANQATVMWGRLSSAGNELLSTVSGIGNAATMVEALKSDSADGVIAKLKAIIDGPDGLQSKITDADEKISTIQSNIQKLEAEKAAADEQRRKAMQDSANLKNRMNEVPIEESTKMGIQAAKLRDAAEKHAGRTEELASEIKLAQAELSDVQSIRKANAQKLKAITETIAGIQKRISDYQTQAQSAQSQAGTFGNHLVDALKDLNSNYNKQVIMPLEQAVTEMNDAIGVLERAQSVYANNRGDYLFNLGAKQLRRAEIQDQLYLSLKSYQHLLKLIANHCANAINPANLKPTTDTIATIGQQIDQVQQARDAQLTAARKTYLDAKEVAREKSNQINCMRQLITATRMLASATNNSGLEMQVEGYESQLRGMLSASPEPPTPTTPQTPVPPESTEPPDASTTPESTDTSGTGSST